MKKNIKESNCVLVIIRRYSVCTFKDGDKPKWRYFSTTRPFEGVDRVCPPFCYDSMGFDSIQGALNEARNFCKWKGLKIRKIEKRVY